MTQTRHTLIMNGDEPAIDQGVHYGAEITWNPDDNRYYVTVRGKVSTFKDWRNAIQFAKRNETA